VIVKANPDRVAAECVLVDPVAYFGGETEKSGLALIESSTISQC
jgi:hypothetical protein